MEGNVHISIRKAIGTGRDGRVTSGLDCRGQKLDVRLFVVSNVVEVVVVIRGVTSLDEVLLGEVLERLFVEDVLKMLQLDEELDIFTMK